MSHQFDELTKSMAQSVTRRAALKKFGVGLAGMALACLSLMTTAQAQTTVVCDVAADATSSSGKGKTGVPPWLDIIRTEVSDDSSGNILFTMTVNAPVPAAPSWKGVDDGGQLWWGWRFVDDLATASIVKGGCIKSPGLTVSAAYFLDLIWDVPTSSFRARLLDVTSCTETLVPYVFSADRTQATLVVAKSLLTNTAIIPSPDHFQFLAQTLAWKANSTSNLSFFRLDEAPGEINDQLIVADWSAANSAAYCP